MSKRGGCFSIFWRADDVTRTMSKGGGGACECPRVGAFFKLMTSRGQCPRGGAPGVPPIQVQTPPPPGWLATGLDPDSLEEVSTVTAARQNGSSLAVSHSSVCACKGSCMTHRCRCKKAGISCSTKCHPKSNQSQNRL